MICPNCHQEISDDSLFCPKCGKKIITEKICPACGKSNDLDSMFCKFCGSLLEEKIEEAPVEEVKPIEEEIKVEEKIEPKVEVVEAKPVEKDPSKLEGKKRVFSIISMSLMIFGIVFLFGMLFVPFMYDSFYSSDNYTIIGYVTYAFQYELANQLAHYQFMPFINAILIFSLFMFLVVFTIVTFSMSLPKFIRALKARKHVDLSRQVGRLYVLYFVLFIYFVAFMVRQQNDFGNVVGGGPVVTLTLLTLILMFNTFTKELINEKHQKSSIIVRSILRFASFVFALVFISYLGGSRFAVYIQIQDTVDAGIVGNEGLITFISPYLGSMSTVHTVTITNIFTFGGISYLLEITSLAFVVILLEKALTTDLNKKINVPFGIAASCIAVTLSALAIVFNELANDYMNYLVLESYSSSASISSMLNNSHPIVCVIMSVCLLGIYIATLCCEIARSKHEAQK